MPSAELLTCVWPRPPASPGVRAVTCSVTIRQINERPTRAQQPGGGGPDADRAPPRVLPAQWLRLGLRLLRRDKDSGSAAPKGLWMKCFPVDSAGQAFRRAVTTSGDGALPGALGEAGGAACDATPSTESSLGDSPPPMFLSVGGSRLVPALLCPREVLGLQ